MPKKLIKPLSILLSAVVITGGVFYITKFAHANSIIVDSNTDVIADDGVCTLREAIEKANDMVTGDPHGFVSPGECGVGDPAGLDTITFSSAMTITLVSALPTITTPVVVDGISGIPGLSCGDLPGGIPHNLGVEVDINGGGELQINGAGATGSSIRGLVINDTGVSLSNLISIRNTSNVQLTCSYLGTDITGMIDESNSYFALRIENSDHITIGDSSGMGNVFNSDYVNFSVWDSSFIEIYGNIVGMNAQGNNTLSTGVTGMNVLFEASAFGLTHDIIIGGDTPQKRNIIGGATDLIHPSTGNAINIRAGIDYIIQGNYVGTDITGTIPMNGRLGIQIAPFNGDSANVIQNILIGGSNPGEGNLISGFKETSGIPNGGAIIMYPLGDSSHTNISDISNVTILGNYFGTDKTGLVDIGAGTVDVVDINGINITIGGTGPNERNIFAGNDTQRASSAPGTGLHISDGENISVKNNYFGVGADSVTAIPNQVGILVGNGAGIDDTTIGGTTPAEGNLIENSTATGIFAFGQNGGIIQNNTIRNNAQGIFSFQMSLVGNIFKGAFIDNKIYNNTGLGINLASDLDGNFAPDPESVGPNLNDISDSDTGPNNNLNYPVIHSITESPAGTLNLNYYLDVPAGSYRVEFYKNPTAGLDSSYHGEGEQFVFADTFTSSGTIGVKTVTFPGSLTDVITPTATECTDGTCTAYVRTSEFGPTVPITAGGGSGAGLDFGDVTTTQTTALSNGAYHILNTNYLGSCIDADTGTVQNTTATADDTTAPTDPSAIVGTCTTPNDDEDGVTFDKATYTIGDSAILTVTASTPGIINVWVDINNNGSFLDAGEQVITNTAVVAGSNTMTGFTVPATNGTYPLRIRYVSDIAKIYQETPGVASPRGEALDGEVEDYNLQVGSVVVPPTPPSGGAGPSGGYQGDICLNLSGTQFLVPNGYIKDTAGLIPGACAPVTVDPTDPKKYTIDVYPLNETGDTKNPTSTSCPYFTEYLKLGKKNNSTEVTKWQNFLNTHMKEKLSVNGTYNTETFNAVKRFQDNYKSDVLTPWGLKNPTGWTYKTTRMKANQIVGCLEKPVYLEIPGITWVLGALKK